MSTPLPLTLGSPPDWKQPIEGFPDRNLHQGQNNLVWPNLSNLGVRHRSSSAQEGQGSLRLTTVGGPLQQPLLQQEHNFNNHHQVPSLFELKGRKMNKIDDIFGSSLTAEEVTEGIDASRITAIVTGSTSGFGRETARVLALRGAEVVIAARRVESGNEVKEAILQEVGNHARVHVIELDISSLDSVRKFVQSFKSKNLPLNVLVNDAGIMAPPFSLSADGIEIQFATNYLGHFLLTNLLVEKMKSTAAESGIEGRIVNVASLLHKITYSNGVRLDKINDESGYNSLKSYGQSKVAKILHAKELARRLTLENANVTINSVHPGVVRTHIDRNNIYIALGYRLGRPFLRSVSQGAATQCFVALHPSVNKVTGKYFSACKESNTSRFAKDPDLQERLWQFSIDLTSSKSLSETLRGRNESLASSKVD